MRHLLLTLPFIGLLASAAPAQTGSAANRFAPAGGKAAATPTTKPGKAPVVRTAKSLDCSKQADAKGLHGKPRKSFMSGCKKA